MAMDAPVRRMLIVLAVFLPIGIASSLWRGDSLGRTVGYALTGVVVCGFFVGCYLWARRKD